MENAEFNLNCLKTIDTKQGAVRTVRFNGKFTVPSLELPGRLNLEYRRSCLHHSSSDGRNKDCSAVLIFVEFPLLNSHFRQMELIDCHSRFVIFKGSDCMVLCVFQLMVPTA